MAKTSVTHPLQIQHVETRPVGDRPPGRIGMTFCPGKKQHGAYSGTWDRDLTLDLDAIKAWGADALVTLVERSELAALKVPAENLHEAAAARDIEWYLLEIPDQGIPGESFEGQWPHSGERLRSLLADGGSIVIHCKGGLGRTGMIAARLLVELGCEDPESAIHAVRAARPDTIENRAQADGPQATDPLSFRERALDTLFGGAIGDAFGYTVEFMHWPAIRAKYGDEGLREPVLQNGRLVVSDDTQMTLFTLEGLLRALDTGADPVDEIRNAYLDWLDTQQGGAPGSDGHGTLYREPVLRVQRAPGNTCLSALRAGGHGTPEAPANDSKGCGTAMRTAPLGLVLGWDAREAFRVGVLTSALTHGHPSGYLSGGAVAALIRLLVGGTALREAAQLILRLLAEWDLNEETTQALLAALDLAERVPKGRPWAERRTALTTLGEGWIAEEALAIAVYAALTGSSYAETLVLAANHDGDSDSTAAIAGQFWAAEHSLAGIPHGWCLAVDVAGPLLGLMERGIRRLGNERC